MTSLKNRLILSLAHRPLTGKLLDALVDETCIKSNNQLSELENGQKEQTELEDQSYHSIHEEKNNENWRYSNPTVHVLLTGSPYVTQPGLSFDEWEKAKWTTGEKVLSKFINAVGLQKFRRSIKKNEVRLTGKLVDVRHKDFRRYETLETQLSKELIWIANNVKHYFKFYAAAPVSEATIIYPVEYAGGDMDVQEVVSMIHGIFEEQWTEKDGPLSGVKINVQIVAISDSDSDSDVEL